MKETLVLVVCLSHEGVGVEVMPLLILILFGVDVIAEILVWDLLLCLEEEGQEVLGDMSSCHQ